MLEITPPTHCPSCKFELEWENHLLYCKNPACSSKVAKRIEHFAKTMKIKGLGPSTIRKLNIAEPYDLYFLDAEGLADALSSFKLGQKLFYEIEKSRNAPLNMVLPSFSIPLIGRTATEKLSTVCEKLIDINETTCARAGLGPKATNNLLSWLKDNHEILSLYPFDFKFKRRNLVSAKENRGTVCISGKLKSYKTKAQATEILEKYGYIVKSSMTKDVSILVNESGIESSKTQRAVSNGITIVTDISELLGENYGTSQVD
jgi:NAD-dependent DNA ligase